MQSLRMGVAWLLSPTIRRDGQVEISRRLPGCQSASQCPAQRRCRSVLHVAAGLDGGRNFCRIWTRCRDNRFPFTDGSTHRDRTRIARAGVLNRGFGLFGVSPSWRRFGGRGSRTRSFTTASATATGCVPQAVPTRDLPVPPSMPRVAGVPARRTGAALSGASFQLAHPVSLGRAEADDCGGCGAQTAKVVSRRISGDRR